MMTKTRNKIANLYGYFLLKVAPTKLLWIPQSKSIPLNMGAWGCTEVLSKPAKLVNRLRPLAPIPPHLLLCFLSTN
jgi:hypothetical protein